MKNVLFSIVLAASLLPIGCSGQNLEYPEILPVDLETDLALSALPPHLRAEAGVYLLKQAGYELHRKSQNGFSCLVRRIGAVPGAFDDSILPICYDAEGSDTLLPAVLEEVQLLAAGESPENVRAAIDAAWAAGTYSVPGPGVSYMLSPVFRLNGHDGGYVPHVMFYGPNKTDTQVGASDDRFDYVPFIQSPGRPSAMMVLPVGEMERKTISEAESGLIERVRVYLTE